MSSDERATADLGDRTRSDLAALRAIAHPTRRAILSLLQEHTTLTATESARLLGVSAKACSYHLAVLADQHLVEEVAAAGRNRPRRTRPDASPTIWSAAVGPDCTPGSVATTN